MPLHWLHLWWLVMYGGSRVLLVVEQSLVLALIVLQLLRHPSDLLLLFSQLVVENSNLRSFIRVLMLICQLIGVETSLLVTDLIDSRLEGPLRYLIDQSQS